ncbi:sortase domain-bontaining protein [Actinomadura sp. CNU-125]|uniref:sortase domain-containing protein n=1 Tax=Actinomadura sp. CNU-125 TaxID=1904961 RepID=UPI0021CCA245|nr:sortase [Actinomadura sp. CNU-125]
MIVGHVDSHASGASVFYRLGALEPGGRVRIDRADGTTAVFTVDAVRRHPKDAFPAAAVYGDTPAPALRLITCGGPFDDGTGHYLDNIVVYAHLT